MSRALQWMVATVTSAQSFIYWPMYVHEVYELEEEEELFPIQGLGPESSDVDSSLGEARSQKAENSIVEGQSLKEEHQTSNVICLAVIHNKIEGP